MTRGRFLKLLFFLALAAHLPLLLSGLFLKSYDSSTHLFLAQHYRAWLFDSWNTKWYGGFDQFSYLPLTHELIAIFSSVFGLWGAYVLVQLLAFFVLVWGIYRFSRIWVSEEASRLAAVLGIFLTSITQSAYQYGQLPTLFSASFLLHTACFLSKWLEKGRGKDLALTVLFMMVVATSHHMTSLIASFIFLLPVAWKAKRFWRVSLFGLLAAVFGAALLSPFIYYLFYQSPSQQVIYHASRSNFLENFGVLLTFFLIPHSYLLFFIPVIFLAVFRKRMLLPLFLVWGVCFVLGMGGTTPLIYFLPKGLANTITFERFSIWATILALPLLCEGLRLHFVSAWKKAWVLVGLPAILCWVGLVFSISTTNFQPAAIDLKPITRFLQNQEGRDFRYLTLGFGTQCVYLNILLDIPTIDGAYHFGRRIPELTQSGIELLDGAKYHGERGMRALEIFLKNPEKYALRYIFSNDHFYNQKLIEHGWTRKLSFESGVDVWFSKAPPIGDRVLLPKTSHPGWMYYLWGSYPWLLLLGAAGICFYEEAKKTARFLCGLFSVLATLPLLGGFLGWYVWWIDNFRHFLVASWIFFLGMFLYSAARLRVRQVVVFGVLMVLCLGPLLSWMSPTPKALVAGPSPLKVFFANAYVGNRTPDRLMMTIHEASPDIVVLAEINQEIKSKISRLTDQAYPYQLILAKDSPFGLAVFSKFPIENTQIKYYDLPEIPTFRCELLYEGRRVVLWATHLVPPIHEAGWKLRNRQWVKICQEISQEKLPVILAGDLNLSMWSPWFEEAQKAGLMDVGRGFGIQSSWPAICPWFLRVGLDHLFVSQDFTVVESRMDTHYLGSDHLPVFAKIILNKSRPVVS